MLEGEVALYTVNVAAGKQVRGDGCFGKGEVRSECLTLLVCSASIAFGVVLFSTPEWHNHSRTKLRLPIHRVFCSWPEKRVSFSQDFNGVTVNWSAKFPDLQTLPRNPIALLPIPYGHLPIVFSELLYPEDRSGIWQREYSPLPAR